MQLETAYSAMNPEGQVKGKKVVVWDQLWESVLGIVQRTQNISLISPEKSSPSLLV